MSIETKLLQRVKLSGWKGKRYPNGVEFNKGSKTLRLSLNDDTIWGNINSRIVFSHQYLKGDSDSLEEWASRVKTGIKRLDKLGDD